MRYVIGAAAFVLPVLLAIAFAGTAVGEVAPQPRLGGPAMSELRDFTVKRGALLDRYACSPGESTDGMPHLALERFDRRGCDPGGRPWFRLTHAKLPCGLLRRPAAGQDAARPASVSGFQPTLILPLTPTWAYWEWLPPPTSP